MNLKKVVFLSLFTIVVIVFAYPYAKDAFLKEEAKKGISLSSGEYKIGDKLPAGNYDLNFFGNIIFQGKTFQKGDKLKAMPYKPGEFLFVEGKGNIEFKPAQYDKLKFEKNRYYIINNSGFYKVGKQLEAGTYFLRFEDEKKIDKETFVQIIDSKENVLKSFSFKDKNEFEITLKNNTLLQLEKNLFKENENSKVILEVKQ